MADTDAMLKDFEQWKQENGVVGGGTLLDRIYFAGWQKGQSRALASRPAEVDDEGLPALPDPHWTKTESFSAEQFRQGQRDAVAADRARMPDADEISDAITEAYNMACVHKDWEAKKCWRELGDKFSAWAAPSHTTNKEK